MPMPTTRYGRFLYYKARQKRRLHLARRRNQVPNATPSSQRRSTTRGVVLDGFTKQNPKVYPRYVHQPPYGVLGHLMNGWSPPKRGQFAWLQAGLWVEEPLGGRGHDDVAHVGYHQRRVLSIPRLKNLQRKDWLQPQSALTFQKVYRGAYYPSGRESYALQMGWVTL